MIFFAEKPEVLNFLWNEWNIWVKFRFSDLSELMHHIWGKRAHKITEKESSRIFRIFSPFLVAPCCSRLYVSICDVVRLSVRGRARHNATKYFLFPFLFGLWACLNLKHIRVFFFLAGRGSCQNFLCPQHQRIQGSPSPLAPTIFQNHAVFRQF